MSSSRTGKFLSKYLPVSLFTGFLAVFFTFLLILPLRADSQAKREAWVRWQAMDRDAKTAEENQVAAYLRKEIFARKCDVTGYEFNPVQEMVKGSMALKEGFAKVIYRKEAECAKAVRGNMALNSTNSSTQAKAFADKWLSIFEAGEYATQ